MNSTLNVRTCCALALACALPLPTQAAGFVDDASVNLNLRNFFINRNFTNPGNAQGLAQEWTQNFILDAKSGFTQGTVGFGVDALGLYSIKLDGGKGSGGTQLLPVGSDGRPADDFGRLAVAGKMKIGKTVLKVGEWMPVLPILRSDDGRSLPQTFEGAQVTSQDIDGLSLYGGQFRKNSPRNDSSMEDMFMQGNAAVTSDRFNFVGGEYTFNEKRTLIGLWNAELKDIYQQQYLQVIHSQPLGDWTLGANLGYFRGSEDGSAKAGNLDNRTISALLSARYGASTFYVGLQKVSGDGRLAVRVVKPIGRVVCLSSSGRMHSSPLAISGSSWWADTAASMSERNNKPRMIAMSPLSTTGRGGAMPNALKQSSSICRAGDPARGKTHCAPLSSLANAPCSVSG